MPPPRHSIDPLWACLCPVLTRPVVCPSISLPRSRPAKPRHFSATAPSCERFRPFKPLNSAKSWKQKEATHPRLDEPVHVEPPSNDPRTRILKDWDIAAPFPAFSTLRSQQFDQANVRRLRRSLFKYGLEDLSTVYKALEAAGDIADPLAVENWVRFLIKVRGEKPNRLMYLALLKACSHHEYGSVLMIQNVLEEMEEHGIARDLQIYESTFRALAAHPSYAFRLGLMEEMRSRWLSLSPQAWHYVCCAQVREKQIELAVETLFKMRDEFKIEPQTWLLDMLVHVLADIGEMDLLAQIFSLRLSKSHSSPSKILWSQILNKAAEQYHHPVVSNAWWAMVAPGSLNPSTGLCTMVLDTAARAGDDMLAIDVFRILSNRSTPIHTYHYEALIEAHLRATNVDLRKVLAYLSAMEELQPGAVSDALTRPVSIYLADNISQLDMNIAHIRELKTDKKSVPIAVLNAVLEALVRTKRLDEAMLMYESLHEFCADGINNPANTATFRILLAGCAIKGQREGRSYALFLAAEMVAHQIAPDRKVYQLLIRTCLNHTTLIPALDLESRRATVDDAWHYLEDMEKRGLFPTSSTLEDLAMHMAILRDDRFFAIIERMEIQGFATEQTLEKASKYRMNSPGQQKPVVQKDHSSDAPSLVPTDSARIRKLPSDNPAEKLVRRLESDRRTSQSDEQVVTSTDLGSNDDGMSESQNSGTAIGRRPMDEGRVRRVITDLHHPEAKSLAAARLTQMTVASMFEPSPQQKETNITSRNSNEKTLTEKRFGQVDIDAIIRRIVKEEQGMPSKPKLASTVPLKEDGRQDLAAHRGAAEAARGHSGGIESSWQDGLGDPEDFWLDDPRALEQLWQNDTEGEEDLEERDLREQDLGEQDLEEQGESQSQELQEQDGLSPDDPEGMENQAWKTRHRPGQNLQEIMAKQKLQTAAVTDNRATQGALRRRLAARRDYSMPT